MVILFILITIILIFVADFYIEFLIFGEYNQTPLDIQTFDNYNQPYHPSVVFIQNGWNGYRYWMVETPYPIGGLPYRDRWECPTIHVSNNGKEWISLNSTVTPIDDLNTQQIENHDFFSDPHLVLKDKNLECFYRFSRKEGEGYHTYLLRKSSKDGINWTEREVLVDLMSVDALKTVGDMVRSHAVLFEDGLYHMWYVDGYNPKGNKHVCLSTSIDGFAWRQRIICKLNGPDIKPWHIDVNHIDDHYYMIVYDFHKLTIWISNDGMEFSFSRDLLSPSFIQGSFYSEGLYRSSIIKDNEGLKVFFSAYDLNKTYLGLMTGESIQSLRPTSINGRRVNIKSFPNTFYHIWKRRIWLMIHS